MSLFVSAAGIRSSSSASKEFPHFGDEGGGSTHIARGRRAGSAHDSGVCIALMSGRGGTSCKSAAAIGERPRRVLIQAAIISFA